jgi:DNA-binding GntR family transcriptional regulator
VAETLREAIIAGEFKPGERLIEEDLSQQMQISRGPIREALRQLEQEGLAISFPYRGTVVAEVSREAIVEVLMPVRVVLEICGFRHARPLMDAAAYEQMEAYIVGMVEAAERTDVRSVAEIDVAFHEFVMTRSDQMHAIQIWKSIEPRIRTFFHVSTPPNRQGLLEVANQHRDLIDALQQGNDEALDRHVRDHITAVPGYTASA